MEIISLDSQLGQQHKLSEYKGIALTHDITELNCLMQESLLLNGIGIFYISKGKASFCVTKETCMVQEGELVFINHGQEISDIMISANMQFCAFFLSVEFMESLASRLNLEWTLRNGMVYFKHLKIALTESEQRNICLYYELLDSKRQQTRHQQQSIDALCEAFGYEILDLMDNHGQLSEEELQQMGSDYGAAQQHFKQFTYLLLNNKRIERKVSWYASQLCITPKYLNIICQQITQQSPSSLIEKEITQRAIFLLREKQLSIKQIAEYLGFNNQSHFGTFFRRQTGLSPQNFRNEQ